MTESVLHAGPILLQLQYHSLPSPKQLNSPPHLRLFSGCWGGANTLFSRAKTSVTLPCTTLSSLRPDDVTELSWVCRGCLESVVVSAEAAVETQLLRLRHGQTTVLQKRGRLSLLEDSAYSLRYEPVEVEDSGEYVCRVDGHSSGAAAIRLLVQGEPKRHLLELCRIWQINA